MTFSNLSDTVVEKQKKEEENNRKLMLQAELFRLFCFASVGMVITFL